MFAMKISGFDSPNSNKHNDSYHDSFHLGKLEAFLNGLSSEQSYFDAIMFQIPINQFQSFAIQ